MIGGGATSIRVGALASNGDVIVVLDGNDVLEEETNIASLDIFVDGPPDLPPVVVPPVSPPPTVEPPDPVPPVSEPPLDPAPPDPGATPIFTIVLIDTIFPPGTVFPEENVVFWPGVTEIPAGGWGPNVVFMVGEVPPPTPPPDDGGSPGLPVPEPSATLLILVGLSMMARERRARGGA